MAQNQPTKIPPVPDAIVAKTKEFLEKGAGWSWLTTPIEGVFIQKFVPKKDDKTGKIRGNNTLKVMVRVEGTKSKIYISNADALKDIRAAVNNPKMDQVVHLVEQVVGAAPSVAGKAEGTISW